MLFQFSDYALDKLNGKIEYTHAYPSTSSAYEIDEDASIEISIPRYLGASEVFIEVFTENLEERIYVCEAYWSDFKLDYDVYTYKFDIRALGVGLYYFKVSISSYDKTFYCTDRCGNIGFSHQPSDSSLFQLTVSDFKYPATNRLGGVIYHIFVDRFNRGGCVESKSGAVMVDDWSSGVPEYPAYPGAHLQNNTFYGGTLYGIIDKLDYIKSLGVNIIYLSPIFSSPSNHKYDTADYMSVDAMFGGDEALELLIAESKKRDIGIVLDGVFNHTGSDSIYFNKRGTYPTLGAYQSKESSFYDWYEFTSFPDEYASWWGIEILPRINTLNPVCRDYFVAKGGVVDKYARMGILGFRLDVADELSDDFISQIKARLSDVYDRNLLYGEVWEDASNKIAYGKRKRYYLGSELDGVMNYPLRRGILDYVNNHNTESLSYALTTVLNNAPKRIADMQMNLLGTHDTERILTVLGNENIEGLTNDILVSRRLSVENRCLAIKKLKMVYTVIASIPGIPSIYYGDEAGLEGYSDPFNRMPYPWGGESNELIEHYKLIGQMRTKHSVYKDGSFALIHLDSQLLVFSRSDGMYSYVTVMNNSPYDLLFTFDCKYDNIIYSKTDCDGEIMLSPYTSEVYKIPKNSVLTVLN